MRYVWTAAGYELLRIIRNKMSVLLLIGLPLLLIFLLGNGLDTSAKQVRTAVFHADQGKLRADMENYLASEAASSHLQIIRAASAKAVQEQVQTGSADYGLVVPEDFSELALEGGDAGLIYYPGKSSIRNLTAKAVLDGYLNELKLHMAVMAVLGPDVPEQPQSGRGEHEGELVDVGTSNSTAKGDFGPLTSLQYYGAAYLIMFLFFSSMGAVFSIMKEKEQWTLYRLGAMPSPLVLVVLGKMAGVMLFAFLQGTIVVAVSRLVFGIQWGGYYGMIALIIALTIVAAVSLAMIITSVARSGKSSETIFTLLIIIMTFLSGGMMPDIGVMKAMEKFTINYWANEGLHFLMSGAPRNAAASVMVLAVIALVCAAAAALRMRKVVSIHE
ncbi:ABC transporter permease [Paenibacillus pinihumi]|uniref:ABC transporter permease n=1 Tax=Paenibacillus pinihumi TaxID=669462 RepID=UPI0003F6C8D5|nr:ABC transporter permease [Paenibacillus pinihumi]